MAGISPRRRVFDALMMRLSFALLFAAAAATATEAWKPRIFNESTAHLFVASDQINVPAPTAFPLPTHWMGENARILIQPKFGKHRKEQDAIFAYAEGYNLPYYMMFLETLRETGYRGDVVLAITEERIIRDDVEDYLRTYQDQPDDKPNVIVYQVNLECDGDNGGTERRVLGGGLDIFQFCRFPKGVYGLEQADGSVQAAHDVRARRVVATLRYEWYWIWSRQYHPNSWLMLIDARDTFFQSNPFVNLPRTTNVDDMTDGLLYFFGENTNATRLGRSTKNLKWLRNGYGIATLAALMQKPTICSGSTMGEQIAIDTYLRALINEHDEADCRMTGSDQGFHNYLYYSRKLENVKAIRRLIVWEQGRGIINNLSALRTAPLEEWGMYNPATHQVYNWDGTLTPVVHQWDRDKHLHSWMTGKQHKQYVKDYKASKRIQ